MMMRASLWGFALCRICFEAYMLAGFVMASFLHPLIAHWIWGEGWLGTGDWRVIDFAGELTPPVPTTATTTATDLARRVRQAASQCTCVAV